MKETRFAGDPSEYTLSTTIDQGTILPAPIQFIGGYDKTRPDAVVFVRLDRIQMFTHDKEGKAMLSLDNDGWLDLSDRAYEYLLNLSIR